MAEWIKCIGIIGLYFLLFFTFGTLVCGFRTKEKASVPFTILIGFFAYYVLFQVVTLPMMFTLQPLSALTAVWCVCVLLVLLAAFIRAVKKMHRMRKEKQKQETYPLSDRIWKAAQAMIVLLHTVLVSVIYYSYWDATYYVGTVSFSVYHNAINTYNPLTGRLLDTFDLKHCLATYHMHDAVVCQLFDVHPLIETKTVMVIVITILVNLAYYCLARRLFGKNEFATAVMMGFCLLVNLCSFSLYTSSSFLLFRTYEGKAITGALVTTVLFYLFLQIYENPQRKRGWYYLTIVSWGAVAVSASAMILVPAAIGAFAVVMLLKKRKWRTILYAGISMLPCFLSLLVYFLNRLGILSIHTWR